MRFGHICSNATQKWCNIFGNLSEQPPHPNWAILGVAGYIRRGGRKCKKPLGNKSYLLFSCLPTASMQRTFFST